MTEQSSFGCVQFHPVSLSPFYTRCTFFCFLIPHRIPTINHSNKCTQAPGGDWLFHRCCVRLGVPLTPSPGMHQVDMNDRDVDHFAGYLLDVVERHPVKNVYRRDSRKKNVYLYHSFFDLPKFFFFV